VSNVKSPDSISNRTLERFRNVLKDLSEEEFSDALEMVLLFGDFSVVVVSFLGIERIWSLTGLGSFDEDALKSISRYCLSLDSKEVVISHSDKAEVGLPFSAVLPLLSTSGERVGSIYVADKSKKVLGESTQLLLRSLAKQIINDLELKIQNNKQDLFYLDELKAYKKGLDEHAIVARTDHKGIITYVNTKFCEISGYDEEELVGQDHRILNSQFHPKSFFENMWKRLRSGKSWQGEIRNSAKDGSLYWVDTTIIPFTNQQGEVREFMAFRYDITKKKEVEALDRQIQALNKVGGWKLDLETMTPSWSDEIYHIHEWEVERSFTLEEAIEFYAPEGREKFKEIFDHSIEKGTPFEEDFPFIGAKGTRKWVHTKGYPEFNKQGKVIRFYGTFQDITEKKEAEISLIENEMRLSDFFTQSRDAVMTLEGPDWQFSSCNPAALKLFKIDSVADFKKMGLWDIAPEFQPCGELSSIKAKDVIGKAVREGANFFEWTHQTTTGEAIPCTVLLSKIVQTGKIYIHAVVRDISEQKKLEKELVDSNKLLELALEGAGLGVWDWYLENNRVVYDKRWAEMLGYDLSELEVNFSTWEDRVHPEDLKEAFKDIDAYMNGETDRFVNVHRMRHKNGKWVHILGSGRFSEWDASGKPTRFTGTNLDVSQAKEGQDRKLSQLNDILFSTPSCLAIINKQGQLIDMNAQGLKIVEAKTLESILKADFYNFIEESHRQSFIDFNERVCSGSKESLIFEIVGLNGTKRWLESYAAPFSLVNGEVGHIAITNDISQKNEDQRVLEEQKAIAQHQTKLAAIGELAAGVGHEINNPLAIVKGYVSVLKNKMKERKSLEANEVESHIGKIDLAINRITLIVRGLRTFSRSDLLEEADFDPVQAIAESVMMVSEIYRHDGIQLRFLDEIHPEEIQVFGNRGKFDQVVMNLISNAKDAVASRNEKNIKISCSVAEGQFKFSILDSGSGIEESIQQKIFEPFFTTKEVNKGTGIGLSLAHSFIKDMKGILLLKKSDSCGSHFSIELPLSKAASENFSQNVVQKKLSQIKANVLLAEDEESVREILSELLKEMGLDVTEVENGKKALDLYCERPEDFDIIISDMQMPEMGGEALIESIRTKKNIKQPIFIISTGGINIDFDDKSIRLCQLIDGYVFKPFDEDDVFQVISHCLLKKAS